MTAIKSKITLTTKNTYDEPYAFLLRQAIGRYIKISNDDWTQIKPHFKLKTILKNGYLIKPGQISNELTFILKGGFLVYNNSHEGTQIVSWIALEDNFISEFVSFFSRSPTPEYIQAIEDTEILTISYDDLHNLYKENSTWQEFGRVLAEKTLIHIKHYVLSLIRENAEERYEKLVREQPEIIKRVPLKYIASYLGVTDSSLSRIRRNKVR